MSEVESYLLNDAKLVRDLNTLCDLESRSKIDEIRFLVKRRFEELGIPTVNKEEVSV